MCVCEREAERERERKRGIAISLWNRKDLGYYFSCYIIIVKREGEG